MQEVIIYRNPLEAAFWHSMSSGEGLVVFATIIGLGILWTFTYVATEWLTVRTAHLAGRIMQRHYRLQNYRGTIALWMANIITAMAAFLLWRML